MQMIVPRACSCQQPATSRATRQGQAAASRSTSYSYIFLLPSLSLLAHIQHLTDRHQRGLLHVYISIRPSEKRRGTSLPGGRTIYEISEDKSNLSERKKEIPAPCIVLQPSLLYLISEDYSVLKLEFSYDLGSIPIYNFQAGSSSRRSTRWHDGTYIKR
jgi:hypothetical protein